MKTFCVLQTNLCWLHVLGAYAADCHDDVADFDLTRAFRSPTWRQGIDHQAASVVLRQEKPKAAAAQWLRLYPLHRGTAKFESSKSQKGVQRYQSLTKAEGLRTGFFGV